MRRIILFVVIPWFCLLVSQGYGAEMPFGAGERMEYEIRWTLIHAATAVLEVMGDAEMDGTPARYFKAEARSAKWIDRIYKVRDTMEAWTNPDVTHSLRYKKDQNEGSYHKKVDLIFDKTTNYTHRYSRGKYSMSLEQPVDVFDPMSILFAFRKEDLYEGMRFGANVTDGKISVVGKAFVEGRETVKTELGGFETFRVKLDIKHLSGVFQKSRDAELIVWFTADERRIPVKVRSKVVVGHFIMELVGYRPPRSRFPLSTPDLEESHPVTEALNAR